MSNLPERRSVRLQTYDYAGAGAYFVTICVRQGRCVLGKIADERMHRSLHGQIARDCWEEIPRHFPTVELDSFVVMPNHVHGILMLLGNTSASNQAETFGRPKSRSVSTVIRSYKAAVSKWINELCGSTGTVWQAGFHEHIIRNDKELQATRRYIELNPLKWALDRENLSATEVDPTEPWETVVQETQFGGGEAHSWS